MKKTLTKTIIMTFRGLVYGVAVQILFLSLLLAKGSEAQMIESVRDVKISLDLKNASLKECFHEIEKKTNYKFSYDHFLIESNVKINFTSSKKPVSEVLMEISKKADLKFRQINNNINVQKIDAENDTGASVVEITIQGTTITGRVTSSEDDQGLPGVNVIVKGTNTGSVTDIEGNYSVEVPDENTILVFSSVGYIQEEIAVGTQTVVNLALVPDITALDEIVVVGYGTMKKSDLTGSVASLKSEDIQTGAVTQLEEQLSGRVSGVQVIQNNAAPGAGATIRIRGTNSILGNNEPLFVIDGMPFGTSVGQDINPNDIESIEILKDASSTAIFGSRGANGVILITTKKGKSEKTQVSFDTYYGVNVLDKKLDLLNAEQLADIHRQAVAGGGITPSYDPNTISGTGTDWQDEIYRTSHTQNHELSISGSSANVNYYLSGNYLDEEGIVHNSDFKRYSLRSNIDIKVNRKFTVKGKIYLTKTANNRNNVIQAALRSNPIIPVKDEDGAYNMYSDYKSENVNPVATAKLITDEANWNRVVSNILGEYKISDNLIANISLSADISDEKNNYFAPLESNPGFLNNRVASVSHTNYLNWISNNLLTYSKSLNKIHHLNVMIGFTAEKSCSEYVNASANGFVTNIQEYHALNSGEKQFTNSSLHESQLASFISRINYNIKDKYLFTLSGRYDGSSKFGKENRWAFFPSGAFAWRISNEDFMKGHDIFSDLKFRASFGTSGEQAIASYQTLPVLNSTATLFNGDVLKIGFIPNRLANPNLKWEKTQQFDIGIDASLWNGRVNFTADFYYKRTVDLLYLKPLPKTSGFSSIIDNVASIENKGMEYEISSVNTTGNIKWHTDFNISFSRNNVLDLGTHPDGSIIERVISPSGAAQGGNIYGDQFALVKGSPIGGAYGHVFQGTYKSQEEIDNGAEPHKALGDAKYEDLDGDGDVDGDDRKLISNPNPAFFGGINNNLSWKGFDLSLFLQFVVGHEIYSDDHYMLSLMDGIENSGAWALDAWSVENQDGNIPKAGWDNRTHGLSTFHVSDASFLRAKNITLGYNVPIKMLGWNIQKLRVYFSVDNAFTITNYFGYNPDVSKYGSNSISSGIDGGNYPLAKTFLLGLNVKF